MNGTKRVVQENIYNLIKYKMVKFKFEDIEIPESNPFQNYQLRRQEHF